MIACDRCKGEFKRGRSVKCCFDGAHKAEPRMRCINTGACDRRMAELARKDPARLLASKRILGFKADETYEAVEDALLVFVEDGLTVVAGTTFFDYEQAASVWRIELAHPEHPEVNGG